MTSRCTCVHWVARPQRVLTETLTCCFQDSKGSDSEARTHLCTHKFKIPPCLSSHHEFISVLHQGLGTLLHFGITRRWDRHYPREQALQKQAPATGQANTKRSSGGNCHHGCLMMPSTHYRNMRNSNLPEIVLLRPNLAVGNNFLYVCGQVNRIVKKWARHQ